MLYRAFIKSSVEYCPLIRMLSGKTANVIINRLHKYAMRALRAEYTTTSTTSISEYTSTTSRSEELLVKSEEVTIYCGCLQKLMIEIHKV